MAAGLACLTADLRAAISVGPFSSPIIVFDSNPPAADISQRSVPGGTGSITNAADLAALVQTNEASMITAQLQPDAGNPPGAAGQARWSSTGQYMQTRPTGNAATLVMATFQNNLGGNFTGTLALGYQLQVALPVSEQSGHLVYYSVSGLANTWVQLAWISNQPDDNTPGVYGREAPIDFRTTPWQAGSLLYVLWADDNGTGTPDTARQIDNLYLTIADWPPTLTDPADATVEQCHGTNFSVQVVVGNNPTFQWYKNGVAIDTSVNPTAASATLLINNAQPADVGRYFCRATNPFGQDDSAPATLTVNTDNTPPALVYAVGAQDLVTVTVTFSEPMNDAATDVFNHKICNVADTNDCLTVNSATLSWDFATVTLRTTARRPEVAYEVLVRDVGDRCNSNALPANSQIPLNRQLPLLLADDITGWRYNHEGVDLGTAWRAPQYDDSSWSNGLAVLGVEDTPPADPPLRTVLVLTNANFPSDTARIPTYYFRTHFSFPGDPAAPSARLKIRTAFDDLAYVYINGVEVYRDPILGTVGSPELAFTAYIGNVAVGNYFWGPYVYIPLTSTVSGDNVVAVQLKQQTGGSSDIAMALELVAELAEVNEICPTIITGQPNSIDAHEFEPVTFRVRATGTNLRYQWQKDGAMILGADQSVYHIPEAHPRDAGTYRVRVYNSCEGVNSILSEPAILTIVDLLSHPSVVNARGLPGETNILITFSNGPLSAASAQIVSNYVIPGITVQRAVLLSNNLNVLLTTTPRTIGSNYSLTVRDVTDAAQTPNMMYPNPTVIDPLAQTVRLMSWNANWKFDTNCQTDLAWAAPGYNDSGWASGLAPIGAEDTTATLMFITNTTGNGIMTRIPQPRTNNVHDHYFRAHFNMPNQDLTAVTWTWNNLRDDGAILYVNGVEVWRRNITNDLSVPVVCADQASAHEADSLSSPNEAPSNLVAGDNVVAVHVKQQGTASSDIVWALQLDLTVSEFRAPRPTLCIFREDESVRIVWPCPANSPPADGYDLQGADNVVGPWNTIPAASPLIIAPAAARQFYRLYQPQP